MGIFDKFRQFRENRKQRQIAKSLKLIQNPKSFRDDRLAALDYFSGMEDPKVAVPALLKRFEYSLEHGINDTREKEAAMEGIIRHEKEALALIRSHLRSSTRIAWPMKILLKLASEKEVVDALRDCLEYGDTAFDQSLTDKNFDILCYLRDYKIVDPVAALSPFLENHDERVRFAAVEALVAQGDVPEIAQVIEPFLADASSENTRVRQVVVESFARYGWAVKGDLPAGPLMPGVQIAKDRRVVMS